MQQRLRVTSRTGVPAAKPAGHTASPAADPYSRQDRGSTDAYAAYYAGMDASMQQKVAVTTPHLPTSGVIADMGSGSGLGTYQLAKLFPDLEVVGVDINPTSVEFSEANHQSPNLSFVQGDIGARLFPDEHLGVVFNSSVLHHLTSFNDFDPDVVREALKNQVASLAPGGVMIIRDFVAPPEESLVFLDLPNEDGEANGAPTELSTAAAFERFARDWRSSVNPDWPVPYAKAECPTPGWTRFKVSRRAATEFVLHKDYRKHWDVELQEEYTYFTQAEFESELRKLGLRVATSMEIHNPWIVENRFEGRFALSDLKGNRLPHPATNYVIVGEKVEEGKGVRLREGLTRKLERPRFLEWSFHRDTRTGEVFELVRRPGKTLDLLPWFESEGRIFVMSRHSHPRPILNAQSFSPEVERSTIAGYISEPVTALVDECGSEEAVQRLVTERMGLDAGVIQEVGPSLRYFTSPGGLDEIVHARMVRVEPTFDQRTPGNPTPFSTGGAVRAMDAQQLLRSGQVGALFDSRLEIDTYVLLLGLGRSVGPWVGAGVSAENQPAARVDIESAAAVLEPGQVRVFERVEGDHAPGFLELRESEFIEEDATGETLASGSYEHVIPKERSTNTATCLPVMRVDGELLVGLERRHLPAAQEHLGSSALVTAPAWRLPRDVTDLDAVERHVQQGLSDGFGASARKVWRLGGAYHPSAGVTAEKVYPFVVEVDAATAQRADLTWVRLDELVEQRESIRDGHLLISALRTAHALGALDPSRSPRGAPEPSRGA